MDSITSDIRYDSAKGDLDKLQAAISKAQGAIRDAVMALTPALQSPYLTVTHQQQRHTIEAMYELLNDFADEALSEAKRAVDEECRP